MNTGKNAELIKLAIENGVHRAEGVKAETDQALTYILSERRYFHHANMESAKAEKYFLQAALGRSMSLYKVWNVNRETLEEDLKLLRAKLDEKTDWDDENQAIDRLLIGAGY